MKSPNSGGPPVSFKLKHSCIATPTPHLHPIPALILIVKYTNWHKLNSSFHTRIRTMGWLSERGKKKIVLRICNSFHDTTKTLFEILESIAGGAKVICKFFSTKVSQPMLYIPGLAFPQQMPQRRKHELSQMSYMNSI